MFINKTLTKYYQVYILCVVYVLFTPILLSAMQNPYAAPFVSPRVLKQPPQQPQQPLYNQGIQQPGITQRKDEVLPEQRIQAQGRRNAVVLSQNQQMQEPKKQ